jgi:hypothetical protein
MQATVTPFYGCSSSLDFPIQNSHIPGAFNLHRGNSSKPLAGNFHTKKKKTTQELIRYQTIPLAFNF